MAAICKERTFTSYTDWFDLYFNDGNGRGTNNAAALQQTLYFKNLNNFFK